MSIPLLDAQLGVGEESTHGTLATPSLFYEFLNESLAADRERIESAAVGTGARFTRSNRWLPGATTVEGDLVFELGSNGFATLLKHAVGDNVTTTQPDDVGAPSVYNHVIVPDDLPEGLTVQIGRSQDDGVVQPFTYLGVVVPEWRLSCSAGEIAQLTLSCNGQDETTSEPLAARNIPTDLSLLAYQHGTLEIAGQEVYVSQANIGGTNGLQVERPALGTTLRRKPIEVQRRDYNGEFEADFSNLDLYNRYVSGEEAQLVLGFEGVELEGGLTAVVKVTANVRSDGDTPTVGGQEEVRQTVPFKVIEDDAGLNLEVEVQTTDATA